MNTTRALRTVAAATMIAISLAGGTSALATNDEPVPPRPTVTGPADDLVRLDWAHERFREAGLDVPEIDIEFHETDEPCEGNLGTVRTRPDGTRIVSICADHEKPHVRDSWRRRTIVHELAHVWEERTISDATRTAFMDLRGLDNWNDRTSGWFDRAIEHVAEVITWGIGDPEWMFKVLPSHSCEEMAAAYELLTGSTAPRVVADPCE